MSAPMGRLAFREEGRNWNCYYCTTGSMVGAILLGSIAMRNVLRPERKSQFMTLMRECFSDVMEEVSGVRPTWPKPDGEEAPDSERTFNIQ